MSFRKIFFVIKHGAGEKKDSCRGPEHPNTKIVAKRLVACENLGKTMFQNLQNRAAQVGLRSLVPG
jgi:hypothetical protein